MQSITSSIALKEAILNLENRQKHQKEVVTEQLHQATESLRPANIIKNAFNDLLKSSKLVPVILFAVAGLTTSRFLKKNISGTKPSFLRSMFGTIFQTVAKAVLSELF
jgi:hypothetical protein